MGVTEHRSGGSMYAQLLSMALGADETGEAGPVEERSDQQGAEGVDGRQPTERALVQALADLRLRLTPSWVPGGGDPTVDAAAGLAANVAYDRALLRLCRLRGVPCGPERFTRPEAERQRLELALAAAGVVLARPGVPR